MTTVLNTGILFRKPGESTYAGVRRFLVANSSRSYGELVRIGCAAQIESSSRSQKGSVLAQLAHQVEAAFSKQLDWPVPTYPATPPFSIENSSHALQIRRNCPVCSAGLFHSPLYELPWLGRCPMHREVLVTRCPTCHSAWPTLNDLWTRRCETCGIHLSRERLAAAQTMNINWDFTQLDQLQACIDYPAQWHQAELIVGHDDSSDRYDTYCRYQISIRDHSLPSIVAVVDPSLRAVLTCGGVPTEPCYRLRFPCRAAAVKDVQYLPESKPAPWIRACQQRIIKKVAAAIAESAGLTHHLCIKREVFWYSEVPHCPYCQALTLWWHLITRTPLRRSEVIERSFSLGKSVDWGPIVPQPMQMLIDPPQQPMDAEAWLQWKRDLLLPVTGYVLPQRAQRLFYLIDLWTSFTCLFRYIEHHARVRHRNELEMAPTESEPHPHQGVSHSVAFWRNADDELEVCIPFSLLQTKLWTPHANFWVSLCSQALEARRTKYRRDPAAIIKEVLNPREANHAENR